MLKLGIGDNHGSVTWKAFQQSLVDDLVHRAPEPTVQEVRVEDIIQQVGSLGDMVLVHKPVEPEAGNNQLLRSLQPRQKTSSVCRRTANGQQH